MFDADDQLDAKESNYERLNIFPLTSEAELCNVLPH